MAHHRTFPIINLTPNPDSIFADMSFPSKESHMVFFLILFSLFFKKIKISDDSKYFLKINFHQINKTKSKFHFRVGTHRVKCGVHTYSRTLKTSFKTFQVPNKFLL